MSCRRNSTQETSKVENHPAERPAQRIEKNPALGVGKGERKGQMSQERHNSEFREAKREKWGTHNCRNVKKGGSMSRGRMRLKGRGHFENGLRQP